MELRSEGKVDLTGVNKGIKLHSDIGTIDIGTNIHSPAGGGIRLHNWDQSN